MKSSTCSALCAGLVLALCGCSGDDESGNVDGGPTLDGGSSLDGGPTLDADSSRVLGEVDFVAIYEIGSGWIGNTAAQQMVEGVLADFESHLRTSGDWNATIEIYLTDDNASFANTTFEQTFTDATVSGAVVRVVPAWQKIVGGLADANGAATPSGTGADFAIHFNVATQADNAGLLRHEIMHGMGAVNSIPNFTLTEAGELTGIMPGQKLKAALYDRSLVDLDGNALLGAYDAVDETFEVQSYRVEESLETWMDGAGGVAFRGTLANGDALDMSCGTFPINATTGRMSLNEPADLMSAAAHPTWDTIDEPDLAFFRSMGYEVE